MTQEQEDRFVELMVRATAEGETLYATLLSMDILREQLEAADEHLTPGEREAIGKRWEAKPEATAFIAIMEKLTK